MMLRVIVLAVLCCAAASGQTQYGTPAAPAAAPAKAASANVCPWLTQGSAASALGGDVSVTVTATNPGEGSCRFSRQQPSGDFLDVLVAKAPAHVCPAESLALKGIGNQAARCSLPGSRGESLEMVSSRVRDLFFTVTLSTRKQKRTDKSEDPHEDSLEQTAEQVAGNLY